MAAVSSIALSNSAFPIIAVGAGAASRPPAVRDTTGLAANSATNRATPNALTNVTSQAGSTQASAFAARDSGIDGRNGVRLAGDNGALLDLSTSLGAQEAANGDGPDNPGGLTEAEEEQVAELRRADREVRRHEAAHAAAGGAFAGAPTYTFERGPDGQLYAVAGQVSIDTAPVDGDPAATIQKLQIVRAAALAPGDPSAQDRAVAAQAEAGIRQAQAELQAERNEELTGEAEASGTSDDVNAGDVNANVDGASSTTTNDDFSGPSDRDRAAERTFDLVANLIDIAV
jgi:hypothetical protein